MAGACVLSEALVPMSALLARDGADVVRGLLEDLGKVTPASMFAVAVGVHRQGGLLFRAQRLRPPAPGVKATPGGRICRGGHIAM